MIQSGAKILKGRQPIPDAPPYDFECTLKYKGKKVAIFTLGDTLYRIYEAIIKYSDIVDVIILAHSTGGIGKNHLPNFMKMCQQHHAIPKTGNNNADCMNIINKI